METNRPILANKPSINPSSAPSSGTIKMPDSRRMQATLASISRQNEQLKAKLQRSKELDSQPRLSFNIDGPELSLRRHISTNSGRFSQTQVLLEGDSYRNLLRVLRPFVELANAALRQRDLNRKVPVLNKLGDTPVIERDGEGKLVYQLSHIERLSADYKLLLSQEGVAKALAVVAQAIDEVRIESEIRRSAGSSKSTEGPSP